MILAIATAATGCTGQLPGSFRLAQQEQAFSSQQEINTKIDLLWVVDNSASMDVSQEKLRAGFAGFASRYMKPTWDIRAAVITTDTYMANPAFAGYLTRTIGGTVGWRSNHIFSRLPTWVNPTWNPNLVNLSTGRFDSGVRYGELVPVWGPFFGRLLPGNHDGPIPALCSELMPYFLNGVTRCNIRDDQNSYNGPSKCLNPDTGAGETSISQCVNTVENDTVRSGRAIIETMPPAGTPGDAAWTQKLAEDFMLNVTTGSAGQGSERGLGSLLQLLADNEGSATAFFRPGSTRGIVFVSDEEDQTMALPGSPPADFKPQSYYRCDLASLVALNGAGPVASYCCSGGGCAYGSEGTSCSPKTIDGFTYTVSVCPREDLLVPVADVKTELDTFFRTLDGADAEASPNYFVVSIVPLTGAAIQAMQAARTVEDTAVGGLLTQAVDRGDRYLELGNLVGNGSLAMNIADSDYSPILDSIGRAIIEKKATFTLARAPTGEEDMIVWIRHADGTSTVVPPSKYVISGKQLIITDLDFVLTFSATDAIVINYQPKSVN
jgi:hypothetical protein